MRVLAICFILLSVPLRADWASGDPTVPTLSARLDRESAAVGDTVILTLDYRLPEGATLPSPPEVKGLEGLTLIGRELNAGRIRLRLLVDRLEPWHSGPIVLGYIGGDGRAGALETGPVSLSVRSILGEDPASATLRPIQDILPLRPRWLQIVPWILGGVAVLVAAGGVLFWKRRRRVPTLLATAMDPPHVTARSALEALEASGLFEKGRVKAFYYEFSQILRQYLGVLRGFPAAEYTTEEIARSLRQGPDGRVLPLLRAADLVKFSDAVPSIARKEEHVREALAFIEETAEPTAPRGQAPLPGAGP